MISENKTFTLGFILLLSIGFSGWYYVRLDPIEMNTNHKLSTPDLVFHGVEVENFDNNGVRTADLATPEVNYFIKQQKGNIVHPLLSIVKTPGEAPWQIQADHATADQNQQRIQIDGHVEITQQQTKITAHSAEVLLNKKQIRSAILRGDKTQLAHLQTVLEKNHKRMDAYAETITFKPDQDTVVFEGQAKITQDRNQFSAEKIIYHIKSERIETPALPHARTVLKVFPNHAIEDPFNAIHPKRTET